LRDPSDQDVAEEFDRRARHHRGEAAVLNAGEGERIRRNNEYQDHLSKRLVVTYLRPGKSESIVDFGCGVGRLSAFLSPRVAGVIGLDVSPGMLEIAAERLRHEAHANLLYVRAGGEGCPIRDGSIDKIVCCWVLAHMSDAAVRAALSEFHRILKPSGRVVAFEQVRAERVVHGTIQVQRTQAEYLALFESAKLEPLLSRPVERFPSYGRWLWTRFRWLPRMTLPLLAVVEAMTVRRKPEHALYHTRVFVATKPTQTA
jgi:ubiquinone/menaquinone biosynthesis C-methylase UbiE